MTSSKGRSWGSSIERGSRGTHDSILMLTWKVDINPQNLEPQKKHTATMILNRIPTLLAKGEVARMFKGSLTIPLYYDLGSPLHGCYRGIIRAIWGEPTGGRTSEASALTPCLSSTCALLDHDPKPSTPNCALHKTYHIKNEYVSFSEYGGAKYGPPSAVILFAGHLRIVPTILGNPKP